MAPLFNYFKIIFDPIYSILESSLKLPEQSNDKIKKVMIPQLTTLLHICNNINPSESTDAGKNTYGIYRIKNIESEVITFINKMLHSTHNYIDTQYAQDDAKKNNFNRQLFQLPKVRLSSLLNKFVNSQSYKDPDSIPYLQFFSIDSNFSLMTKDTFMNPKNPEMTEELFNQVSKFFTQKDLYIVCTKTDNIRENIPMNVYEIDFNTVDISESGLKIDNIPNNYFNKYKDPVVYFENLVKITPYVVYNDAELALSIFMLFKELMPVK